jgi:hypothetical protein
VSPAHGNGRSAKIVPTDEFPPENKVPISNYNASSLKSSFLLFIPLLCRLGCLLVIRTGAVDIGNPTSASLAIGQRLTFSSLRGSLHSR